MSQYFCVDFDGVIHSCTSPWTRQTEIRDRPTPGGQDFIRLLQAHQYTPIIQSARASSPHGRQAIEQWMRKNGFPIIEVTNQKPQAIAYLDDRGIRFNGTWPTIQDIIAYSKTWNKR